MSVRQENRWRKLIKSTLDAQQKGIDELESLRVIRPHRAATPMSDSTIVTRAQVRRWMQRNADDYECATTLAEGANAALDLPHGCMDDETHWIWDEAFKAHHQQRQDGGEGK